MCAQLVTDTACLGAGSPGTPSVLAINGARVSVAILFTTDGLASLATVGDVGDDGA